MGHTDNFLLPWPELPDAADGPDGIMNLAVAVDTALKTQQTLQIRLGYNRRLEARTVLINGANSAGGMVVFFAKPFTSVPDLSVMSTSGRAGFCPVLAVIAGQLSLDRFGAIGCNAFNGQAVTEAYYVTYIAIGADTSP